MKRQIHGSDELNESEENAPSESVSLEDAYLLPVLGSAVLYGLYIAFTQWDRTYVNYALAAYFGIMGTLATAQVGVTTLNAAAEFLGIEVDNWHINLVRTSQGMFIKRIHNCNLVWPRGLEN